MFVRLLGSVSLLASPSTRSLVTEAATTMLMEFKDAVREEKAAQEVRTHYGFCYSLFFFSYIPF
jgi:hypothetical protein